MPDVKVLIGGTPVRTTRAGLQRMYHCAFEAGCYERELDKDRITVALGFGFTEAIIDEEGEMIYSRRLDQMKNFAGLRNSSSPHWLDFSRSFARHAEARRTRLFRQRPARELTLLAFKKLKGNTAIQEAKRQLVATLIDNGGLGIRLLTQLRGCPSLTASQLIALVPNASVDSFVPVLARLKRAGLVSLYNNRFSCTGAGNEIVRRIQVVADKNSASGTSETDSLETLRYAVHRVYSTKESGEMNTAMAQATAPAREIVEGYDEAMNDANYRAYLEERAELEAAGKNLFVAYSGGRRIAKAATMEDLLAQIEKSGEKGEVLIQEVPEKVVSFRQPFQVEA